MLAKLASRLKEQQDIVLTVTEGLIDETVKQGYDPTFGARPMRRFLQEHVEKAIADRLIRKEIKRGDTLTLDAKDIQ